MTRSLSKCATKCLLALFWGLAILHGETFAEENKRPAAAEGYHWQELTYINGACQVPDQWQSANTKTRNALVYTFSPTINYKDRPIEIGLTINVTKEMTQKSKVSAAEYARAYVKQYAKRGQVLSFHGPDEGETFERLRLELIRQDNMRVILLTLANLKTDTLYIISFGCPKQDWDKYKPNYDVMLNPLLLDDEV